MGMYQSCTAETPVARKWLQACCLASEHACCVELLLPTLLHAHPLRPRAGWGDAERGGMRGKRSHVCHSHNSVNMA